MRGPGADLVLLGWLTSGPVYSGKGLSNNKHPYWDLCSCNIAVLPGHHWYFNTLQCRKWAFSLHPQSRCNCCFSEIKWTLMIGFYIKPAGLEKELDEEFLWGPEVNMTNFHHSIFIFFLVCAPASSSPAEGCCSWSSFFKFCFLIYMQWNV